MLRRLAFGGVRVSQASGPITVEGETFPAGTWVIPTDQEYIALAREVLIRRSTRLARIRRRPARTAVRRGRVDAANDDGRASGNGDKPSSAGDRASLKVLAADPPFAIKPTPYNAVKADAEVFDSVPGTGFESSAMAAQSCPAGDAADRQRCRAVDRSRRDECLPRHQRRVESQRDRQPLRRSLRDQRHERSGVERSRHVARDPRPAGGRGRKRQSRSCGSRCSNRRTAWTRAGRSGCSSAMDRVRKREHAGFRWHAPRSL